LDFESFIRLKEICRGFHGDKEIREKLWPLVKARGINLLVQSYEFGDDESEDEYECNLNGDDYSDFDYE